MTTDTIIATALAADIDAFILPPSLPAIFSTTPSAIPAEDLIAGGKFVPVTKVRRKSLRRVQGMRSAA